MIFYSSCISFNRAFHVSGAPGAEAGSTIVSPEIGGRDRGNGSARIAIADEVAAVSVVAADPRVDAEAGAATVLTGGVAAGTEATEARGRTRRSACVAEVRRVSEEEAASAGEVSRRLDASNRQKSSSPPRSEIRGPFSSCSYRNASALVTSKSSSPPWARSRTSA